MDSISISDEDDFEYICRVCLYKVKEENLHFINDKLEWEEHTIISMLEKCLPELNTTITINPVICLDCYQCLKSSYTLKLKCMHTEKVIYNYLGDTGLDFGSIITLKNVIDKKSNVNLEHVKVKEYEKNDDPTEPNDTSLKHDPRPFTCAKCEYKASKKYLLKRHMQRGCKKKETFQKCPQCNYTSKRKRNMTRHMLTHGGDRPHVCNICKKGFTEKNQLRNHMYNHKGDYPFKCEFCASTFMRNSELKVHVTSHKVKLEDHFNCNICGQIYKDKKSLKNHLKTHVMK